MLGNDIFTPSHYRYKDTGETYRGASQKVVLADDVYFYAVDGREIVPAYLKPPETPTAHDLFFNTSWSEK